MEKTIGVFGGTGLLGTALVNNENFKDCVFYLFVRSKSSVRKIPSLNKNLEIVEYDNDAEYVIKELNNCQVVINFAGASIAGKKWTKDYKQIIYDSRINSTRRIVNSIKLNDSKPELLINASATGIYGSRQNEELNENSEIGNDFLANLCTEWENEALKFTGVGNRVVLLRTGIVLSREGGALQKFINPFKFFVGGHQGSGKQWISWIHIQDFISIIYFVITNNKIEDSLNCTSEFPVTNKDFANILGETLNRPSFFFVPEFILKIVLGEFSETILTGQRVIPEKLLANGFKFEYPDLKSALDNLLAEIK
ncbi:MAG TPA: TIGR01777 family oxidoreductase [Ignavibacteria bacterium]